MSFLRSVFEDGVVHCAFLMGKSRLAPLKAQTIPRLELMAAVLAVKQDAVVRREMRLTVDRTVYWCDSMIVIQYVRKRTKRLKTFVANRVATIHEGSSGDQWRYVDSSSNPADIASRGIGAQELLSGCQWSKGPEYLWGDESEWPELPRALPAVESMDPEVKKEPKCCAVTTAETAHGPVDELVERHSSWYKLRIAVAWLLRFVDWLRSRQVGDLRLHVDELKRAEKRILCYVQRKHFGQEIKSLESGSCVSRKSLVYPLEPWLKQGLLRVGGRLKDAPISVETKFPVVCLVMTT